MWGSLQRDISSPPSLALRGSEGSEGRRADTPKSPHSPTPCLPAKCLSGSQYSPRREGAAKPSSRRGGRGSLPLTAPVGSAQDPNRGAQRRGRGSFCGGKKGLGLSPGGSRGAAHAWSRLPVGSCDGKALAAGRSGGGLAGYVGEFLLFSSRPQHSHVHPTSDAAFPALTRPLSCPEAPQTKAFLLPPPALSPAGFPLTSTPRAAGSRFAPFFHALQGTEPLSFVLAADDPFPPFSPPSAPASVPPSRPSALLSAARPGSRTAPDCAQRGRRPEEGGTRRRGTGASSAPCLFSFPP